MIFKKAFTIGYFDKNTSTDFETFIKTVQAARDEVSSEDLPVYHLWFGD